MDSYIPSGNDAHDIAGLELEDDLERSSANGTAQQLIAIMVRLVAPHLEIEKEALGYGDVLISAIIGFLFGWPGILAVLVGAIILGGLVSLSIILIQLIRKKYQPFSAIPYAPFLIICALGILYFAH